MWANEKSWIRSPFRKNQPTPSHLAGDLQNAISGREVCLLAMNHHINSNGHQQNGHETLKFLPRHTLDESFR